MQLHMQSVSYSIMHACSSTCMQSVPYIQSCQALHDALSDFYRCKLLLSAPLIQSCHAGVALMLQRPLFSRACSSMHAAHALSDLHRCSDRHRCPCWIVQESHIMMDVLHRFETLHVQLRDTRSSGCSFSRGRPLAQQAFTMKHESCELCCPQC